MSGTFRVPEHRPVLAAARERCPAGEYGSRVDEPPAARGHAAYVAGAIKSASSA